MAIARITFTVRDASGETSTCELKIPASTGLVDAIEFAQDAAQIIANVITGEITNISISFDVSMLGSGLKLVANVLADVAHKVGLIFRNIIGNTTRMRIPTLQEGKVLPASDELDRSDAAVAALETALTSGLLVAGGATVLFSDAYGNPIGTLDEMREVFRTQTNRKR